MDKKLKQVRTEIDQLDSKIISLLYKRFTLAEKAYEIKHKNKIDIEDVERESSILSRLYGMKTDYKQKKYKQYILSIYKNIFKNSKIFQNDLKKIR